MSRDDAAIGAAGNLFYEASQALIDAATALGADESCAEQRADYMRAMRVLAVHVAEGDDALSAREDDAIDRIFWLDQYSTTAWARDALAGGAAAVDHATEYLAAGAALLAGQDATQRTPEHNLICRAVDCVVHTVLAHDGSAAPEVERLTAISTRLRQAVLDAAADHVAGPPAPASPVAPAAPAASTTADAVAPVLAALDRLVGLATVKQQVTTLTHLARVFAMRRAAGLPVPPMSLHLVFLGNPGTGKTTVARLVAQLYGALGLLTQGQLVEVDRSGLVADYVGQTATKVQKVVDHALGGVLFVDEAYALADGGAGDFGQEAVATLIKAMEDHRADLVVIAAGYTDRMQRFLDINPGLRSRIGRDITFPDYAPADMVAIFRAMAADAGYTLPNDADATLTGTFQRLWDARGPEFANARDVRNAFERVIEAQADRLCSLAAPTSADMTALTSADLAAAETK